MAWSFDRHGPHLPEIDILRTYSPYDPLSVDEESRPAYKHRLISSQSPPSRSDSREHEVQAITNQHSPGTKPMNALSTLNDLLAASSASDIILYGNSY